MKTTSVEKCYEAPGTLEIGISKSPREYLKLKMIRDGGSILADLCNNMDIRYGEKTTPTTRRTSYDHDARKYY